MADVCYNGSHGTSVESCNTIRRFGFQLGSGRAGSGVYFWLEGALYKDLAKAWFKYKASKDEYEEENPECAIIFVELRADDSEFLDCEDYKIKEQIFELGRRKRVDMENEAEVAKLHNLYIGRLEKKTGKTIRMLLIRVAPPPGCYIPFMVYGAPLSCVARSLDCIRFKSYEIC